METRVSLFIDKNQTSFMTEDLKGFLDCIIVGSNNKVDILIESALGYLILKDKDIIGVEHFCPRERTQAPEMSQFDYPGLDKFLLNEPVIITVTGQKNTTVELLFRLEDVYEKPV